MQRWEIDGSPFHSGKFFSMHICTNLLLKTCHPHLNKYFGCRENALDFCIPDHPICWCQDRSSSSSFEPPISHWVLLVSKVKTPRDCSLPTSKCPQLPSLNLRSRGGWCLSYFFPLQRSHWLHLMSLMPGDHSSFCSNLQHQAMSMSLPLDSRSSNGFHSAPSLLCRLTHSCCLCIWSLSKIWWIFHLENKLTKCCSLVSTYPLLKDSPVVGCSVEWLNSHRACMEYVYVREETLNLKDGSLQFISDQVSFQSE